MTRPIVRVPQFFTEPPGLSSLKGRRAHSYQSPCGSITHRGWPAIAYSLGVSPDKARSLHSDYGLPVLCMDSTLPWTTQGAIDQWINMLSRAQRKIVREMRARERAQEIPRNKFSASTKNRLRQYLDEHGGNPLET